MVEACHKAKILVSVLNPAHTAAASQAHGKRAKTDPCDAAALHRLWPALPAAPTAAVPPAVRRNKLETDGSGSNNSSTNRAGSKKTQASIRSMPLSAKQHEAFARPLQVPNRNRRKKNQKNGASRSAVSSNAWIGLTKSKGWVSDRAAGTCFPGPSWPMKSWRNRRPGRPGPMDA